MGIRDSKSAVGWQASKPVRGWGVGAHPGFGPTYGPHFKINHFTEMCCGDEAGSYLRLMDSCITQLKAQGTSRTSNEKKKKREYTYPGFGPIYGPMIEDGSSLGGAAGAFGFGLESV